MNFQHLVGHGCCIEGLAAACCGAGCCSDWNPSVDQHLVKNYNITNFKAGKAACKAALQEELGLPVNPNIPLVAFIGRLDYQKGADIVLQVGLWQGSTVLPANNICWVLGLMAAT